MVPDTDLTKPDDTDLSLHWSGSLSLTWRILAVNIFVVMLLIGGFFYLDGYRSRLVDQRQSETASMARIAADALVMMPAERAERFVAMIGVQEKARVRLYRADGALALDGWQRSGPTYRLIDPASEPWQRHVARGLDQVIDTLALSTVPPFFAEPTVDRAAAWPEIGEALRHGSATNFRYAPDRTPMISAAIRLADGSALLITQNSRDILRIVRAERFRLGIVVAAVIMVSVLLSLFLARTIVRPLRRLARAAVRVRLGRARDVTVPRLPSRRDEIGLLARALSDMTAALRKRMDGVEAFAADVTHELKNPLASLRSAVEGLRRVDEPSLRAKLLDVVDDDIRRLDRLITDVAEASRMDARLARAKFEPVDLGITIENLLKARESRAPVGGARIAFARPRVATATVMGDEAQLVRVIENLLDNALSFAPADGVVRIDATRDGQLVQLIVEDNGPGVPEDQRSDIFKRFHSARPEQHGFGTHSGLGLAIAKAIVEGHDGTIAALPRSDGASGARFVVTLPASADGE